MLGSVIVPFEPAVPVKIDCPRRLRIWGTRPLLRATTKILNVQDWLLESLKPQKRNWGVLASSASDQGSNPRLRTGAHLNARTASLNPSKCI